MLEGHHQSEQSPRSRMPVVVANAACRPSTHVVVYVDNAYCRSHEVTLYYFASHAFCFICLLSLIFRLIYHAVTVIAANICCQSLALVAAAMANAATVATHYCQQPSSAHTVFEMSDICYADNIVAIVTTLRLGERGLRLTLRRRHITSPHAT